MKQLKIPETQLNPIFTQHFVYPFMNNVDTSLIVKLMNKNVPMLLDTGAHVSVLPKRMLLEVFGLPVTPNVKLRHSEVKKYLLMGHLI